MSGPLGNPMQRGACPSLARPMQTGDGLLSRLSLARPLAVPQFIAMAELALCHGNGLIEISLRGNLQFRGLTAASAPQFAAAVTALDLPLRDGIALDCNPLCALDPLAIADPQPIIAALQQGIAQRQLTERLAAKLSITLDSGGHFPLSTLSADIGLIALDDRHWLLGCGIDAADSAMIGAIHAQHVADAVLVVLDHMAVQGKSCRGRDLSPELLHELLVAWLIKGRDARPQTIAHPLIETFALRNGQSAMTQALAFGRIEAKTLIQHLQQAHLAGMASVLPILQHRLLFMGSAAACDRLSGAETGQQFIRTNGDPRLSLVTCTGAPGCGSAAIDTGAVAQEIEQFHRLLDGSFQLHVSGCAKGCAHPQASLLTLTGQASDRVAFLFDDRANGQTKLTIPHAELIDRLATLSRLVAAQRLTSETNAACLRRLGAQAIHSALMRGNP